MPSWKKGIKKVSKDKKGNPRIVIQNGTGIFFCPAGKINSLKRRKKVEKRIFCVFNLYVYAAPRLNPGKRGGAGINFR
jgi:hypothetical protein